MWLQESIKFWYFYVNNINVFGDFDQSTFHEENIENNFLSLLLWHTF